MTLQECFDNNDMEGFLLLAWNLCSLRKLSHHEYTELKEIHDNWETWKSACNKVIYGNLGIANGKFIQ